MRELEKLGENPKKVVDQRTTEKIPKQKNKEYQEELQKPPSKEEREKKSRLGAYNYLDSSNPYRNSSSLDLSTMKSNWRWIETEVLLELIRTRISSSEWSVFFYILHLTRGHCNKNKYYRTTYDFPVEEIQEFTGLSKSSVNRSLKSLLKRQMIYQTKERGIVKYGINFRYDTWVSYQGEVISCQGKVVPPDVTPEMS